MLYLSSVFFCLITLSGIFSCQCLAVPSFSKTNRIVGGSNASITEYPHQAALVRNNRIFCGGSIISTKFILTAGHCTYGKSPSNMQVQVGYSVLQINGTLHLVSKIYIHPQYVHDTLDYDVSLVKLAEQLIYNSYIQPITLATSGTILRDGLLATTTGFGRLTLNGEQPRQLQVVEVPIITKKICKNYYTIRITDRMICAGYPQGGKDTCTGDSGGPLVISGILIGITSWGDGCGDANSPGVYTSLPVVRTYVDSIVNHN